MPTNGFNKYSPHTHFGSVTRWANHFSTLFVRIVIEMAHLPYQAVTDVHTDSQINLTKWKKAKVFPFSWASCRVLFFIRYCCCCCCLKWSFFSACKQIVSCLCWIFSPYVASCYTDHKLFVSRLALLCCVSSFAAQIIIFSVAFALIFLSFELNFINICLSSVYCFCLFVCWFLW